MMSFSRAIIFFTLGLIPAAVAVSRPEELVNIRQGTYTWSQHSTGNTLPLVGLPWGHSHWSPEGPGDAIWFYDNYIPKLVGVRCTHQPSPWIRDWGWIRVGTGFIHEGWDRAQAIDAESDTASWSPYHFGVDVLGMGSEDQGNARVDLTATTHGAMVRFKWPRFDSVSGLPQLRYIRIHVPSAVDLKGEVDPTDDSRILMTGGTKWRQHDDAGCVGKPDNYTFFFHAEVTSQYMINVTSGMIPDSSNGYIQVVYSALPQEATVRVGESLISPAVAASRLTDQIPRDMTFDELVAKNKQIWNEHLMRIDVVHSGFSDKTQEEELLKTFYSSMYRAMMFPRNIGEMVGDELKHWSPYSDEGGIFEGPLSTDSGFWDAYHTVYTFLELFFPEQLGVILNGYINAFKEGEWLPQWASPGYRTSMVGTMSDVSFASAMVKGYEGFDYTEALKAMHQNAFVIPPHTEVPLKKGGRGRRGLQVYMDKGYIPRGAEDQQKTAVHEVVSNTLYHSYADWAILKAIATVSGQTVFSPAEITLLEARVDNWENLFDTGVKFFRAKDDTNFIDDFDEFLWGGDFTEGGPWQFRFCVPHDVLGLAAKFGGEEEMCAELDKMNSMNYTSFVHRQDGNYGQVIHEMLEMPLNVWAQNSHNNQPSHHVQYLFAYLYGEDKAALKDKCLNKGQDWIRKTLFDAYNSTHFAGDEDNGEMGAWFVLSSLGLYDITPGGGNYVLGIPLFKDVKAKIVDKDKRIAGAECNEDVRKGTRADCYVGTVKSYVDSTETEHDDFRLTHAELVAADTLWFDFGKDGGNLPTTTSTTTKTATTTSTSTTTTTPSWQAATTPLIPAGVEDNVNIRQGTYSFYSALSYGNSLPLVGLPWGHTHWAPETAIGDTQWWFNNHVPKLQGVRCTHQPSPWIREWGWFRINTGFEDEGWDRAQPYDPEAATTNWSPYHFGTDFLGMSTEDGGNVRIDMTASSHGALIRFRWPAFDANSGHPQKRYIRFYVPDGLELAASISNDLAIVTGGTNQSSGNIANLGNYTLFFYAELEGAKPDEAGVVPPPTAPPADPQPIPSAIQMWYPTSAREVNIRIGLSLISAEVAKSRLEDEIIRTKTFEVLMAEHKKVWNDKLSGVEIVDSGFSSEEDWEADLVKTFYSCMYRAMLFPRNLGETVGDKEVHWSPYHEDGGFFDGPLSTDSGFWDAYHTVYTYLQLFFPDQLGIVLEGYNNAFKEGGWMPQWASPGYRSSMVGTMSDVVFADAIVKGFDGFDYTTALQAMKKNAFTAPAEAERGRGRRGLDKYIEKGYIPRGTTDAHGGVGQVVSRSLYHAFADWGIAKAARAVTDQTVFTEEEITKLEGRAENWKIIYNEDTQFFQAKNDAGDFLDDFNQYLWGGDETEAGPWQFRFFAPHDPHGMAEKVGGAAKLCELVEEMNTHASHVHRQEGNYGGLTNEMIEISLNVWGQNSHNNQVAHHVQYMYVTLYDGVASLYDTCLARGQHWLRKTMLHTYNSTHFAGDEDNGEMSAWFVLNALGLYDMAPGSGGYDLGIPLFKEVKANLLREEKTIKGSDCNHGETCLVKAVAAYKGGALKEELPKFRLDFAVLKDADTLEFEFELAETTTTTSTTTTTTTTANATTAGGSSSTRHTLCAAALVAAIIALL